jgi:hypothetical protein
MSDMLDDLRESTQKNSFDDFDYDSEDAALAAAQEREVRDRKQFLGLRPVERMMLSIFLFMNVTVLMLAALLATGRIAF